LKQSDLTGAIARRSSISCISVYASVLPFNNIAQGLFVTTYYGKVDPAR